MAEDHITQYAKSVIAIAHGKPSTFFQADITLCRKIIDLLSIGNFSQPTSQIADIFKKANLEHEPEAPRQIADKIIELLSL